MNTMSGFCAAAAKLWAKETPRQVISRRIGFMGTVSPAAVVALSRRARTYFRPAAGEEWLTLSLENETRAPSDAGPSLSWG